MSSHADKLSPFFNFKHAPVTEIWPEKMLHYLLIFIIFIPILILILVPIHIIYSQTLLHIDAFTHRLSHTSVTHTATFTQRRFVIQTLLDKNKKRQQKNIHTNNLIYKQTLYTKTKTVTHTHKRFYTKTFSHTQTPFTHKRFYTQPLWHTKLHTHRHVYRQKAVTHRR